MIEKNKVDDWKACNGVDVLTAVEELEASGQLIPAREAAGIRPVSAAEGVAVQVMHTPAWLCDEGGTVLAGALGVLVDTVLGTAVMSTVPAGMAMVTSHLHIEMLSAIPHATTEVSATGRLRSTRDRLALAEGEVCGPGGVELARGTIGSVLLDSRPSFPAPVAAAPPVAVRRSPATQRLLGTSPVHRQLGTTVRRAARRNVVIEVPAAPELANLSGGLHGGIGVLIGERALDLALRVSLDAADTSATRLVDLRAVFVRGIPADGAAVTCRATVVHLGRRLAAARSEVLTQDGKPAVLVDATYIAAPPQEPGA